MPFVKLETNIAIRETAQAELASKLSGLAANILGKPESYVMAVLEPGKMLVLGGTDEPAAFVTLDSIGLPEERTAELAGKICGFLETELDIPKKRTYIAFGNLKRHLFGWNGGTF